jgi:hypothetical protein
VWCHLVEEMQVVLVEIQHAYEAWRKPGVVTGLGMP